MTDRKPPVNRVLASLPSKSYARLRAQLEPVILSFGQILYEPGELSILYTSVPRSRPEPKRNIGSSIPDHNTFVHQPRSS
jgi:hypothetical protein